MKIDFDKMPADARIWIYQANRSFATNELSYIQEKMDGFMLQWQSHGEAVKVGYTILYHQFIVLAIDQDFRGASGCSIDSSVAQIKALDQILNVDLLNKLNIAYLLDDAVMTTDLSSLKNKIQKGEIDKKTIIFNNTIQTIKALGDQWKVPAETTWLAKYFKKESLI